MSEILYQKICAKMVREDKSLFLAVTELDLGMTRGQCDKLSEDQDFCRVLRGERLKLYKEIAGDPQRSKNTAIGQLLLLADRLIAKGLEDKAAGVILHVAKLEGWLQESTQVNVFGDLSQKDINAMREKVAKAASKANLMN